MKGKHKGMTYDGDLQLLLHPFRIGIVGARKASEESIEYARAWARGAAAVGAVVVSGLARGVDAAAMRATHLAGGQCIGVMATPIEETYPPTSLDIREEVVRKGLLVSLSDDETDFLRRTRYIAELSHIVIVLGAEDRSGSGACARHALKLKRPTFMGPSAGYIARGARTCDAIDAWGATRVLRALQQEVQGA